MKWKYSRVNLKSQYALLVSHERRERERERERERAASRALRATTTLFGSE
jgi:hypothetical protein